MKKLFLIPLMIVFFTTGCKKEPVINSVPSPAPTPSLPPSLANIPPIAKAGTDISITLPLDTIWLNGGASYDPEGKSTKFNWKQISGPEVEGVWIANQAAAETNVKLGVAGTYQFQLTVTDQGNAFALDTIQVVVHDFINPPELSGREVVFDNQVWVYVPGPVGGDYFYLGTPERPDLFLNPYVKVQVFIKYDTVANWMPVESWRTLYRHAYPYPDYLFSIGKSTLYIDFIGNGDISGKKSSVKVRFL